MVYETAIIQNMLHSQCCECTIIMDLAELERASRNNIWNFLLVDKNYLQDEKDVSILEKCLGILNCKIPIAFFDTYDFNPHFINSMQMDLQNITKILERTQIKIQTIKSAYHSKLRPAEKKLYALLKTSNEKSFSLDEMAIYLWGVSSTAHIKTLYSYIHRIKQILRENNDNIEWLIKEKKGCYKISSIVDEAVATIK